MDDFKASVAADWNACLRFPPIDSAIALMPHIRPLPNLQSFPSHRGPSPLGCSVISDLISVLAEAPLPCTLPSSRLQHQAPQRPPQGSIKSPGTLPDFNLGSFSPSHPATATCQLKAE
ncbi:hypothetical protein EMPG_16150 [Blastomyces silverae]|uniref:Uncharacterized protein n=1 Tax=Blastomyces silverae TaxID=2060906 RepID=A0A0H1BBN5_9EURO|nr:hypothetical protein EMPG_16150 [Blastomyces silverae]